MPVKSEFIDILFGFLMILIAVFAIVVRFKLSGYKKYAPRYLFAYCIAFDVHSILYGALTSLAITRSAFTMSFSAIFVFILIAVKYAALFVYFKKRAVLFVN